MIPSRLHVHLSRLVLLLILALLPMAGHAAPQWGQVASSIGRLFPHAGHAARRGRSRKQTSVNGVWMPNSTASTSHVNVSRRDRR